MRQGIWELRGRCSEPKKLKNAQEFTETVFSSEVCSVTHQKPEQQTIIENEVKETVEEDNTMFTGDVVVFDDIEESWRDEEMETSHVNEPPPVNLTASNLFSSNESECERVTKVIGNLPIAVYEGSPRRYGMRHVENNCTHPQLPSAQSLLASPSVYPPRPGFPQRVVCTPNENHPGTSIDRNQFSVSKTRKLNVKI